MIDKVRSVTDRAVDDTFVDAVADFQPPPDDSAGRYRALRLLGWVGYLAAVVAIIARWGVPSGRQSVSVLLLAGLAVTCIGHPPRRLLLMLRDWLPFIAVLLLYDQTRGVADAIGLPVHEADAAHAEAWLFGGTVPSVWLQAHLREPLHIRWYDALTTITYCSYFFVTPLLAAWLWVHARPAWKAFITRVLTLSVAGLVTFVLFPEAPPWMASEDGALPGTVLRSTARGWTFLHLGSVHDALQFAQSAGVNEVAAMPSLHIGLTVLVVLFAGARLKPWGRYVLALYPLAMGYALVYLGEHYVIDLIAGAAYAVVVDRAVTIWERRRSQPA